MVVILNDLLRTCLHNPPVKVAAGSIHGKSSFERFKTLSFCVSTYLVRGKCTQSKCFKKLSFKKNQAVGIHYFLFILLKPTNGLEKCPSKCFLNRGIALLCIVHVQWQWPLRSLTLYLFQSLQGWKSEGLWFNSEVMYGGALVFFLLQ
jgi:hypothetical protein